MHLDLVPGEERGEEPDERPPEAPGANGAAERPVDRRPDRIDDVSRSRGGARRGVPITVRQQAHVLRPPPGEDRVDRYQRSEHDNRQPETGRAPAAGADEVLRPGQEHDGADPHPGERDAEREPAPPYEPVGHEEAVPGVTQAQAAAGDEKAERHVEMPWP